MCGCPLHYHQRVTVHVGGVWTTLNQGNTTATNVQLCSCHCPEHAGYAKLFQLQYDPEEFEKRKADIMAALERPSEEEIAQAIESIKRAYE